MSSAAVASSPRQSRPRFPDLPLPPTHVFESTASLRTLRTLLNRLSALPLPPLPPLPPHNPLLPPAPAPITVGLAPVPLSYDPLCLKLDPEPEPPSCLMAPLRALLRAAFSELYDSRPKETSDTESFLSGVLTF